MRSNCLHVLAQFGLCRHSALVFKITCPVWAEDIVCNFRSFRTVCPTTVWTIHEAGSAWNSTCASWASHEVLKLPCCTSVSYHQVLLCLSRAWVGCLLSWSISDDSLSWFSVVQSQGHCSENVLVAQYITVLWPIIWSCRLGLALCGGIFFPITSLTNGWSRNIHFQLFQLPKDFPWDSQFGHGYKPEITIRAEFLSCQSKLFCFLPAESCIGFIICVQGPDHTLLF